MELRDLRINKIKSANLGKYADDLIKIVLNYDIRKINSLDIDKLIIDQMQKT